MRRSVRASQLLPPLRTDAGRYRELDVLERLRDYPLDGVGVFHNIALHMLRGGEIFKRYGDAGCDVARQGRLQRVAMQDRLKEAGLETTVMSCLVLPDHELGDSQVISVPRDRIIDA